MPKRQTANASAGAASSGAGAKKQKRKEPEIYQPSKGYKEKILAGPMDLPFFIIVMILLVMGIVMMFSASYAIAIHEGNDGLYYVKRQMVFACIGLAGMLIVSKIDYHLLRKTWIAYGFFLGALMLLVLVLIMPGGGKFKRWIYIGSFHFQPSEIMKLAIIVLFAYMISVNYPRMKTFKYGILPFAGVLAVVAGLMIAEPHISGTVIICAIGLIMIFVGGASLRHFGLIGIVSVGGLAGLVFYLVTSGKLSHVMSRIQS
ncbi:MAG TPA: FtsW/RodA/SpoVE family cell cycle protein, partial [Oscillospiraceae bacterium]|nr:FtsW/RodA/SpoVE family cell cycle protein [Oscillospiraceae bacterium]